MIGIINDFTIILICVVLVLWCISLMYDFIKNDRIAESSRIERYYDKQYIYQNSEDICKSHPPEECTDEELKWIIDNTMHYWNINHCIEYNKRKKK